MPMAPEQMVAKFIDRVMLAKHGGVEQPVEQAWRSEIRGRIDDLLALAAGFFVTAPGLFLSL